MRRSGVTLVELMVVLVILAIATGLSSVALHRAADPRAIDAAGVVLTLRRDAIREGRPLTRVARDSTGSHVVTAFADGRVWIDSGLRLDQSPATTLREAR